MRVFHVDAVWNAACFVHNQDVLLAIGPALSAKAQT